MTTPNKPIHEQLAEIGESAQPGAWDKPVEKKWCSYCKSDTHGDVECNSTRPVDWKPAAAPAGETPRKFVSVHDQHCCKTHGCKYGDDDCPVFYDNELGVRCEQCEDDACDPDKQRIAALIAQLAKRDANVALLISKTYKDYAEIESLHAQIAVLTKQLAEAEQLYRSQAEEYVLCRKRLMIRSNDAESAELARDNLLKSHKYVEELLSAAESCLDAAIAAGKKAT